MRSKKLPVLTAALVLSGAIALCSIQAVGKRPAAVNPIERSRAFRNADWGMALQEVERASGAVLIPAGSGKRFFEHAESDPGHYLAYEQRGVKFLGRDATVVYSFRDDHLFACHVILSDADADRLDADMRGYLKREYGDLASESEDDSTLKLVWQLKDKIINYWFMEEELSLRTKYTAVFGVTQR